MHSRELVRHSDPNQFIRSGYVRASLTEAAGLSITSSRHRRWNATVLHVCFITETCSCMENSTRTILLCKHIEQQPQGLIRNQHVLWNEQNTWVKRFTPSLVRWEGESASLPSRGLIEGRLTVCESSLLFPRLWEKLGELREQTGSGASHELSDKSWTSRTLLEYTKTPLVSQFKGLNTWMTLNWDFVVVVAFVPPVQTWS